MICIILLGPYASVVVSDVHSYVYFYIQVCAELLLHHVEFLDLQDRVQMLPALSWIACSASLSRECSIADKVANYLLHAMEIKRTSAKWELSSHSTTPAAWTEISFFLRPLFSLSSSERCGAARELLNALQNCCNIEGYVPWWISQSVICARRKSASHYTHDPFRYFLLFDREESLTGCPIATFVNLVQGMEDNHNFEYLRKRDEQVVNLLDFIKSSVATCGVAKKCALQQLLNMPMCTLLQVAEHNFDLLDILVNEIVNWLKLDHPKSAGMKEETMVGSNDGGMHPKKNIGEACLHLLTKLAASPSTYEISRIRSWLVSNPKERVELLLPLVFHPNITVRKDIALLLTFLLFSADLLYFDLKKVYNLNSLNFTTECPGYVYYFYTVIHHLLCGFQVVHKDDQFCLGSCMYIPYPSGVETQVFVPSTFMSCYRFPCCAVAVDLRQSDACGAETQQCEPLIHHMVEQLKLLDGRFHETYSKPRLNKRSPSPA